jgi:type II secretory pathway pseudopilin PulG
MEVAVSKEFRKNGWTFVETLLVAAIIGILASIFVPQLNRYWKHRKACEKAVKMHQEMAPTIGRLIDIYQMPESIDRENAMNAFRTSEEGETFFEEFCPSFAKCSKPTEIQKDYPVSLILLCFEKSAP